MQTEFQMLMPEALWILFPFVGLWMVTYQAPSIPHLFEKLITKEPTTSQDVEDWLIEHRKFFFLQWYLCVWCQALRISLYVGFLYSALYGGSILWSLVHALTCYPLTALLLWTLKRLPK